MTLKPDILNLESGASPYDCSEMVIAFCPEKVSVFILSQLRRFGRNDFS